MQNEKEQLQDTRMQQDNHGELFSFVALSINSYNNNSVNIPCFVWLRCFVRCTIHCRWLILFVFDIWVKTWSWSCRNVFWALLLLLHVVQRKVCFFVWWWFEISEKFCFCFLISLRRLSCVLLLCFMSKQSFSSFLGNLLTLTAWSHKTRLPCSCNLLLPQAYQFKLIVKTLFAWFFLIFLLFLIYLQFLILNQYFELHKHQKIHSTILQKAQMLSYLIFSFHFLIEICCSNYLKQKIKYYR